MVILTKEDDVADEFPEHEKLQAVKDQSQVIGEFIEFGGYTLCTVMYHAPHNGIGALSHEPTQADSGGRYVPVSKGVNQILAEYFGIDLDKIEQEKRQMLDRMREINERRAA